MKTETQSPERIEGKLDTIIHLLAAPLIQGKTIADSTEILTRLGLSNSEIASICNTSEGVVRKAQSRMRLGESNPQGRGGNNHGPRTT